MDFLIRPLHKLTSRRAVPKIEDVNSPSPTGSRLGLNMRDENENAVYNKALMTLEDQSEEVVLNLYLMTNVRKIVTCSICKEPWIDVCALKCGHMFCQFCLISWLRVFGGCPQCQDSGKDVHIPRIYQVDGLVLDTYEALCDTFGSTDDINYEDFRISYFATKEEARRAVDKPSQLALKPPQFREQVKVLRRRYLQDNPPFPKTDQDQTLLQTFADVSKCGHDGLMYTFRLFFYIVMTGFLALLFNEDALHTMPRFVQYIYCIFGTFVLTCFGTYINRQFLGEVFEIEQLCEDDFSEIWKQEREEEVVQAMDHITKDQLYEHLIADVGAREILQLFNEED